MLDIKFIKANKALVERAIENKKVKEKIDVEKLLSLYEGVKKLEGSVVGLRTEQNKATEGIKMTDDDEKRQSLIDKATELKKELKEVEAKLEQENEKYETMLLQVPNVTHPDMPVGQSDEDNLVLRKWGEPKQFDFEVKDHVELGEALGIIDIENAAKVSGSRFYYLKGDAVLLQFAIVNFVFDTLTSQEIIKQIAGETGSPFDKPFTLMLPPVMVKPEVMKKMDRLDPVEERYLLKDDELVLVGSAEHTMGPVHMDEMLDEAQLPIRYIGYSTAFRREAGSYGQDVRGILRVHQFDKLEMETYVAKEHGEAEHDFILGLQEYMMQSLNLPYQVVQICTGDTGKPDYNQYDIETWIPSQGKYRETHTADYMTDYQARRLNIKYKTKEGEKEFVHMNDATAFAISRILIAILENYQKGDGSVEVPEMLRKYVGKDLISIE
ncbi:serine--tRNA ligase [Candidatus Dojkabacteria bacterium]|nr:serine--tRNA ligase [Candidatus Dojkabacteria bacterium]